MKTKRIQALAFLLCGCLLLSGCSFFFNASQYVQVSLDAIYHGDFTEYTQVIDQPAEQAEKNYEAGYKAQADRFAKTYGLVSQDGSVSISEDVRSQIEELYKQLYADVSYTVDEKSTDTDDGYEVRVTIRPVSVLVDKNESITGFVNQYNADIKAGVYNDETAYPQEKLDEIYADGIIGIFSSAAKRPTYGDEITIPVHVMHNAEKNSYYINADDLQAISDAVIEYPT